MSEVVSVIIPAYNAEKYLAECIDSVLNQTYENVELIIVNDGSQDGTRDILDKYASKHSNIQVIHTENGGVSRARNIGLKHASGDYIMFLDSDDTLTKDAIQIMYNEIIEYDADIVSSVFGGEVDKQSARTIFIGEQAIEKSLEDHPIAYAVWGKLYKKDFLGSLRFIEGRKIHEDSYFVFQYFLKQPKVVLTYETIYIYRYNEDSASHAAFSEKYFDILYFAEEKWKAIEEQYPQLLDKAKNMLVKSNIAMLQCFLNTKEKRYKKNIKECIRTVKKYKKYFIPTYPGDSKRFKIVTYNLYGIYKWLYRLKYSKRINKA